MGVRVDTDAVDVADSDSAPARRAVYSRSGDAVNTDSTTARGGSNQATGPLQYQLHSSTDWTATGGAATASLPPAYLTEKRPAFVAYRDV